MPPLATKSDRDKGSSSVQAPRSASQVNFLYEVTERGRESATHGRDVSGVVPPSSYTLSIKVCSLITRGA